MAVQRNKPNTTDTHPDPITNEPGAHPIGVGVGTAAGGAAAGAALGAAAGPVGAIAGAVVGGVVGGLAGKGIAEAVNPSAEDSYWREHYHERPYVTKGMPYEDYRPAYQYGWEARKQYAGKPFEEVEPQLRSNWDKTKTKLNWDKAKEATRDAWDRIDKNIADNPQGYSHY